ncbi:hypothetical protein SynM161_02094 [Synechococcus sp. M16.1]|nr:hypothetical protein SynM161_02094 [Synechococcus sp. M16.1]
MISFAPIWLFAPFLHRLILDFPERLNGLSGVVACSSSSAITKRFSFNRFDRQLVDRLITAEEQLLKSSQFLDIPCFVLRPTLVYGRVGPYVDKNLHRLILFMRRLPLLPFPVDSGLRQPLHASQLADVVLEFVRQFSIGSCNPSDSQIVDIGGDYESSYGSILRSLQQSLPLTDSARRCFLLPVPNRLFYSLAFPLLFLSPKSFEAVLRVGSDLSGFTKAHHLLNSNPQSFPVLPLL